MSNRYTAVLSHESRVEGVELRTVELPPCGNPDCEGCKGTPPWIVLIGDPVLDRWVTLALLEGEEHLRGDWLNEHYKLVATDKVLPEAWRRMVLSYGLSWDTIQEDPTTWGQSFQILMTQPRTPRAPRDQVFSKKLSKEEANALIEQFRPEFIKKMEALKEIVDLQYDLQNQLPEGVEVRVADVIEINVGKVLEGDQESIAKLIEATGTKLTPEEIVEGTRSGNLNMEELFKHLPDNRIAQAVTMHGESDVFMGTTGATVKGPVNKTPTYDDILKDFEKTQGVKPKFH